MSLESIKKYDLNLGKISKCVEIEESIIRYISERNEEYSGYHAQGKIKNVSKKTLATITVDVSFYDSNSNFLGLNENNLVSKDGLITDFKKLGPGETLPFDIDLDVPEKTHKCILNVLGKTKLNFLLRIFD